MSSFNTVHDTMPRYETDQDSGDMTNATNDTQSATAHDTDNAPEPAILPVPENAEPADAEAADADTVDAEPAGDAQEGRELREV